MAITADVDIVGMVRTVNAARPKNICVNAIAISRFAQGRSVLCSGNCCMTKTQMHKINSTTIIAPTKCGITPRAPWRNAAPSAIWPSTKTGVIFPRLPSDGQP